LVYIDPTKVVRAALQGAASVAGLLITIEAMVAELPKKQSLAMPGGPRGRHGLLTVQIGNSNFELVSIRIWVGNDQDFYCG
jgi:hypothetical protein